MRERLVRFQMLETPANNGRYTCQPTETN
jgi:hypothetical protein